MDEDVVDDLVPVLRDVPPSGANEILALLGSQGIEAAYDAPARAILVPAAADDAARRLLVDVPPAADDATPEPKPPAIAWSRRGASALVLVVLACATVFALTHLAGPPTRDRLLAHGAVSWSLVEGGETWRLFSAIFLHFDGAHLLTNLLTLALIGPPLAHQLGAGRFLLVFVVSGVAGNVLSHLLVPTVGLKGGASGAISGVLGALAGQTLRPEFRGRRRRWQILGALAAAYALLVGIGADRDNTAHAGGLLAGLLLGRLVTPLPSPAPRTEAGSPGR